MSFSSKSTTSYGLAGVRAAVFSILLLFSGSASAADFRYEASHVTSKKGPLVWKIMSSYRDICDKGCKYHRKNLVEVRKIPHLATKHGWYTWTHVSTVIKDVKYFTKVTIRHGKDGNFVVDNRQVVDRKMIKNLEKKTGLAHSPAFDSGNTRTITKTLPNGKTSVKLIVTLSASGVVALWPSKVRSGMKEGVAQTFKNIGE